MRYEVTIITFDGLMSTMEVEAKSAAEAKQVVKRTGSNFRFTIGGVRPLGYKPKEVVA